MTILRTSSTPVSGTRAVAVLAGLFIATFAVATDAGVITSATGPIRVNGQEVVLKAGEPLTLNPGDVIETLGANAVFQSGSGETGSGDRITIERGTSARADGVEDGVDFLFVESGTAYGDISDKTSVGGSAGWASAPEGQAAKIFLEVPTNRPGSEATFRSIEGGIWVRYHDYRVWLPEQHTVTLAVDPARPDRLAFRTSQQNAGDVRVIKAVGGGDIITIVPKATVGRIAPEGVDKTRIDNDIASLKTGKIRLETQYPGRSPQKAALGPGTYAVIDNATGDIQVSFSAVEFVILERAISLTQEFSTLSQSNFSDVGNEPGRR